MAEDEYFPKLYENRKKIADVLDNPAARGLKNLLTGMYAETAHFIYELLQNADDVNASSTKFILDKKGLTFIHNGTIPFSISNPDAEDYDKEKGKLGHINAITSIGNSAKTIESSFDESNFIRQNKIGKFGIGFKSVFQYTNSPEIYDDQFRFRIDRLIVPQKIINDNKIRKKGETLFYFPFNLENKKINPVKAYEDILDKLKNLVNPILFLNSVKQIDWELGNIKGTYVKKIIEDESYGNIIIQKIRIKNYQEKRNFLVFTRYISDSENFAVKHPYSISYVTDFNFKKILHNESYVAYCFFPTHHETKLNFLVNAPFILTDNRENIKEQEAWNIKLVEQLSELCVQSLFILRGNKYINDDFFNVLPINTSLFYRMDILGKIVSPKNLFEPVYKSVLNALKEEELLPVDNGEYFTKPNHAYLIRSETLIKLLKENCDKTNYSVLSALLKNKSAKIVFSTITEKQKVLWDYVRSNLVKDMIDPEKFSRMIDNEFIKQVSDQWLINLYTYLLDLPFLWLKGRKDAVLRKKPIVVLESDSKKIVVPFDSDDKPQVFLPTNETNNFPTVKSCFVQNRKSKQFLIELGIKQPEFSAEIYSNVIPKYHTYKKLSNEELLSDFKKLYQYFISCPGNEKQSFINKLEGLYFLKCKRSYSNEGVLSSPAKTYFPTENLILYFEYFERAIFLDLDFYKPIIVELTYEKIFEFLLAIGISDRPRKILIELKPKDSVLKKHGLDLIRFSRCLQFVDYEIDGLQNLINNITLQKSAILWSYLLDSIKDLPSHRIEAYFMGIFSYKFHSEFEKAFDSQFLEILRNSKWLYNTDHERFKPNEISVEDLAEEYDISNAQFLFSVLHINETLQEEIISRLGKNGRQAFELAKKFIALGYTLEDLELLKKIKTQSTDENEDDFSDKSTGKKEQHNVFVSNLINESKKRSKNYKPKINENNVSDNLEIDRDDMILNAVNTEEEIKKKREKLEDEIAEIIRKDELIKAAQSATPYSYSWFKALLELEYNTRTIERIHRNPIYVKFSKIERDPQHENTIILSGTDYIPYSIEDNGSLKLTLYFKNHDNKVILLEAVSPQKKILKAKIIDNTIISDILFNEVESAIIEVKNADFIFENLKESFERFSLEPFLLGDEYNFKNNLTPNIQFVFGPPGTGKTTYLARHEIVPRVLKSNLRILVLTPTNKAADVLTNKIIEACIKEHDTSFPEWLVRFGITQDSDIETSRIYYSTKKINRRSNCLVLITTIARFPYDIIKFDSKIDKDMTFAIKDFKWDYIIFDEASMINLPSMVYTIYYTDLKRKLSGKDACKYIIGGDPFQLGPIIQVEHEYWKEGNIYTLVGLSNEDSFTNPQTLPHNYPITNLEKQYRSIPQIGSIYSRFAYNDKLQHHRQKIDVLKISVNNLPLSPINIIEFPISKYDSIYKPRKIKGSPYHLYSAIFSVELIKYIIANFSITPKLSFRIGIICPYRIQQIIIDKMIASIENNSNISITTGTVHGFQGDECEMIINLLNPPTFISNNKNIFLNNKNLINVSISRARDYLILLLPFDASKNYNVDHLHYLKKIKQIINYHADTAVSTKYYTSEEIEKIVLSKKGAIEEFSFPTNHQSINIYTNPAKKYEIRYDENAIDIQIK